MNLGDESEFHRPNVDDGSGPVELGRDSRGDGKTEGERQRQADMHKLEIASKRLGDDIAVEAVILFGSQARRQAGPDSDWDLCVVIAADADLSRYSALRLWHIVSDLGLPIDLITVRASDLRDDRDNANSLAFDIAREGLLLHGSVPGLFQG